MVIEHKATEKVLEMRRSKIDKAPLASPSSKKKDEEKVEPSSSSDLLWDCFVNWAEILERIEKGEIIAESAEEKQNNS